MIHFPGVSGAGIGTLLIAGALTLIGFLFAVAVCSVAGGAEDSDESP